MKTVDLVYKHLKDKEWFQNLSMDRQGEICIQTAEQIDRAKNDPKVRDLWKFANNGESFEEWVGKIVRKYRAIKISIIA